MNRPAAYTGILLLIVTPMIWADVFVPPSLTRRATDLTGTLSQSELQSLEGVLRDFETATSTQIVVLMVPTTGDTPVEEAGLAVAEKNGIGREGKDNGVLLLVAREDRAVRIEVGYGLEGALTDALSGIIIRREIIPRFRNGQFYDGLRSGVDAIIRATQNEYEAESPTEEHPGGSMDLIMLLLLLGVLLSFLLSVFRGGRRTFGRRGMVYHSGWGSSGGWGGGSGGGGFSGGGGSFGGGGASGRW